MVTSGLGASDVGDPTVIGGLSRQFYRALGAHYGMPESWTFEPHVASRVFADWIDGNKIPVYRRQRLAGVVKSDNRLIALHTENGSSFEAAVFVDTSYEGDLLAAAGVRYAVGREDNNVYDELYNGVQYARNHHHFLRFVDPYRIPGVPSSGLLPLIAAAPIERQGEGDRRIQAYNFRLCLTQRADIKVPFPRPVNYDPDRFELLRRYIDAGIFDFFNLNRPVPNGKTDHNNWGAVNSDFIGGNYGWPDGTYEERQSIYLDHIEYQQGLFYFLANDSRLPAMVRECTSSWGLSADEFTDSDNWPPQLYIREARRMISELVITEHECLGRLHGEDPVGYATYRMDSHNCKRVAHAGRVVNEGNVEVAPLQPIPVPYKAICPRRRECANLLVPVCLSASHIAYGSVRMEPVFMVLGESAGTAAALAIDKSHGIVQDLSYSDLAPALESQGQVLLDPGILARKTAPHSGLANSFTRMR
jgi:hypothetical protein